MPSSGSKSRAQNTSSTVERSERAGRIRALNDQLRARFTGGMVVTTAGVQHLGADAIARILVEIREFDNFNGDNDPYGEHDFGALDVDGHQIFWKISYYDKLREHGSEDPSSPEITSRVLTIMLASEY